MEELLGRYYRYYRFYYSVFAFMSIFGLLIFQYSIDSGLLWVRTTLNLIITIPFLLSGIWIMGWSIKKYFFYLSGIDVFGKKRETLLQQDGLHQVVRHPLYLGTLLFIWSLFVLFPFLNNLIACIVITAYTIIGIRLEERKLLNEFGENYRQYSRKVPMLIPRIPMRISR